MFPLKYEVEYPEKLSRALLLLKIFFGWLYVGIPHGFCLFFLFIGLMFAHVVAFFTILFTGNVPRGLFDYIVGVHRWAQRVGLYLGYLTDHYPPFSLQSSDESPLTIELEHPEKLSRGLVLLKFFFGQLYIVLPHMFVLMFLSIWALILQFLAFWSVLFTGEYPKSFFDFIVGVNRWSLRVNLYLLRDEYPPFSMK